MCENKEEIYLQDHDVMLPVQCTAVLSGVVSVYTSSDYSQQEYLPDSLSQMELSSIRYTFNSFCYNFLVWV